MKVSGKELRFRMPFWPTRRRLGFLERGNMIQLLETAVVVEGYLQRFSLPIIDMFFRRALSEWTTVTIPYSRILDYRYRTKRLARWLWTLVAWLPAGLLGLTYLDNYVQGRPSGLAEIAMAGGFAVGGAVLLTVYFFWRGLLPRNVLTFRKADGKPALILFSIRPKERQRAFHDLLVANRLATRPSEVKP